MTDMGGRTELPLRVTAQAEELGRWRPGAMNPYNGRIGRSILPKSLRPHLILHRSIYKLRGSGQLTSPVRKPRFLGRRTDAPLMVTGQAEGARPSPPQQRTEPGRTPTAGGAQPLSFACV